MRWRVLLVVGLAGGLGLSALTLAPETPATPQDRPLTIPLPSGALRLTVFGTSLSAPPQTWPEALAARLSDCRGAPVALSRVTGPGMGSAWALTQVERVIETDPDLVLIEFAINDADLLDGVSLATARAQHESLLKALQAGLPEAALVLMTMSPAQGPRGWVRPRLNAHYAQYRALADAFGIGLVDLYPRWLARPEHERGLGQDGLHPEPRKVVPTLSHIILELLSCGV